MPDARTDLRFSDNPLVVGKPYIHFYAGAPLVMKGGEILGKLCVIDRQPRELTESQLFALRVLSNQVLAQIRLLGDVRKLEEREAALRSSEREQRQLADELTTAQAVGRVGSWELNGVTGQITWSEEKYRIFETNPQKHIPTMEGFLQLIHADDRQNYEELYAASLTQSMPYLMQHRIVVGNGKTKYIEERWQFFHNADGGLARVVGTCQDITERKLAEEERDRLFNLSVDMLCVATFEGKFLQVNPAWTRFLGWSTDELNGRHFFDFVHPDDLAVTRATLGEMQNGVSVQGFKNRYRCKDGSYC